MATFGYSHFLGKFRACRYNEDQLYFSAMGKTLICSHRGLRSTPVACPIALWAEIIEDLIFLLKLI